MDAQMERLSNTKCDFFEELKEIALPFVAGYPRYKFVKRRCVRIEPDKADASSHRISLMGMIPKELAPRIMCDILCDDTGNVIDSKSLDDACFKLTPEKQYRLQVHVSSHENN